MCVYIVYIYIYIYIHTHCNNDNDYYYYYYYYYYDYDYDVLLTEIIRPRLVVEEEAQQDLAVGSEKGDPERKLLVSVLKVVVK